MTDRLAKLTTQLLDAFDRRRSGFPLPYEEEQAIFEATRAECRALAADAAPDGMAPEDGEVTNALRFLDHAGRELMGYESPDAIPAERWETFRLGLVQSASVLRRSAAPADAAHGGGNEVVCGDHWHGLSGEPVNGSTGCPWCLLQEMEAAAHGGERESQRAAEDILFAVRMIRCGGTGHQTRPDPDCPTCRGLARIETLAAGLSGPGVAADAAHGGERAPEPITLTHSAQLAEVIHAAAPSPEAEGPCESCGRVATEEERRFHAFRPGLANNLGGWAPPFDPARCASCGASALRSPGDPT